MPFSIVIGILAAAVVIVSSIIMLSKKEEDEQPTQSTEPSYPVEPLPIEEPPTKEPKEVNNLQVDAIQPTALKVEEDLVLDFSVLPKGEVDPAALKTLFETHMGDDLEVDFEPEVKKVKKTSAKKPTNKKDTKKKPVASGKKTAKGKK